MRGIRKGLPVFGLAVALALAGCSGGDKAPEAYAIGEDSLPALGAVEGETEEVLGDVSQQTQEETGQTTYVYTGLTSGKETVQGYVDALLSQYDCSVIDEDGVIQEEPSFDEDAGTLLVGKNTAGEDGVFQLQLDWTQDSCTVTPSVQEGEQITQPPQTLTLEEAVDRLESIPVSSLGLTGAWTDYTVYGEDGYVMVDDQTCYRLGIYDEATHSIQGIYLLSLDGTQLYRLDRESGQVSEVK